MKLLRDVDGDEVSLVSRAANRRKFLLLKGAGMDNDLSEILEVPWEREGALLDEIRKDGVEDENVEKAVIAAIRLLKGVEEMFSPEMVEKLGTALYPRNNFPLNTAPGVGNGGDLFDAAASDEDAEVEGSSSGGSTTGSASGDDLEGSGSAPKVAADSDGEEDDDAPGKKGFFGRRSKTKKEDVSDVSPELVAKEDLANDEERGTVETHAVPVQKEDGSWDYSDVPDESAAFFRAMIQKQDEQAVELKAAKEAVAKADDTLLSRQMIEKAARLSHVAPTDDLAPVLKAAAQSLDAETFEKLESILTAAQERVSKGELFKEQGSRVFGGNTTKGDAWSQIEKKADELVEKGDDLSREAAIDRVLKAEPSLYNEYMFENGMGVS